MSDRIEVFQQQLKQWGGDVDIALAHSGLALVDAESYRNLVAKAEAVCENPSEDDNWEAVNQSDLNKLRTAIGVVRRYG